MANDLLKVKAKVLYVQRDLKYGCEILENGAKILGYLAGKLRQNSIVPIIGDVVTIEINPIDITKGRIVYRERI